MEKNRRQVQDTNGMDNRAYTAGEFDFKERESPSGARKQRVEVRGSRNSCYGAYVKALSYITRAIDKFYFNLAKGLIKHPYIWFAACILLIGLCCIGYLRFESEARTEKLYVPQNSQSEQDQKKVSPYYGTLDTVRLEDLIFLPKSGKQLMTTECIEEAKSLVNEVMKVPGYEQLCVKKPSYIHRYRQYHTTHNCSSVNPLEIIINTSKPLEEFNRAIENNFTLMSNGKLAVINIEEMTARSKKVQNRYTEVNMLRVKIYMRQNHDDDTEILKWEKKYSDLAHEKAKTFKCASVQISAQRTLDDAISESTTGDIALVSVAFTIMITFACVMLGKFTNVIRGHSVLAFFGVLSTALGIGAGFGLSLGVGTPFVSIVGILPFLVLSIGIDDMFIIVDEFDKQNDEPDPVQRIPKAMRRIGATITMTTLTDITAFAVSVSSDFPAIRYFCAFAAITFTVEFILQVTLFVVFLSFDARRIRAKRRECLPFCKGEDDLVCMAKCLGDGEENLANIIVRKYATYLMKWPAKVLVLLISSGLLAGGIYGCFNVSQEFSRRSLVKDGTPFIDYLNTIETDFEKGLPVFVAQVGVADYTDKNLQDQINKIGQVAFSTNYYQSRYTSWLQQYTQWSKAFGVNIEGANFTRVLPKFFSIPSNAHFFLDVRFNSKGEIVASRTEVFMKPTTKSQVQKDAMLKIRDEFKARGITLVPYADNFIYFEQFAAVVGEVTRNICVAAAAVLVMTLPFCINPVVILLLLFGFASLITELIGLMYFWDVSINSISMINLVMSIGFAIDYSAHVAHAFVTSRKATANERVIDALSSIGASVFMGGASTFLGMLVTAFASSEIFRIFFRMLFGIVVFGLFNGLVLLPVLFSLLGFMIGSVSNAHDDE